MVCVSYRNSSSCRNPIVNKVTCNGLGWVKIAKFWGAPIRWNPHTVDPAFTSSKTRMKDTSKKPKRTQMFLKQKVMMMESQGIKEKAMEIPMNFFMLHLQLHRYINIGKLLNKLSACWCYLFFSSFCLF